MMGTTGRSWIRTTAPRGGIEWARAFFRGVAFSPHRHDTYAIGCTLAGIQAFDYRGEGHRARPGDGFVLHPDERHDGRQGTDAGYGYRAAYLEPALIAEALDGAPLPFVGEAVTRDPRLTRAIAGIFPDPDEAGDVLWLSGAVARLADALAALARVPARPSLCVDHAAMRRVRDHLLGESPRAVAMADLERVYGIDRYALSRQFRAAFGVSPHRFMTFRRLDVARRCIARGVPLAEAAAAAGFADQSHMTRRFRTAFGLSPGRWRRLLA